MATMEYVAYTTIPAEAEEDQILPFPEQPSCAATWVREIAESRGFLPPFCGIRKIGKNMYYSKQFFEGLFGQDQACPIKFKLKLLMDGVMQEDTYQCYWKKGATSYYIAQAPVKEVRGKYLVGAQWRLHKGVKVLVFKVVSSAT